MAASQRAGRATTRLLALALCLLASSLPACSASVVELTADNFDTLTASGDWLVEFYAPWCSHCNALRPDLERAALQLAAQGASVRIGRVDAPEWRSLQFRFGVVGYPTFYHVHNGGAGVGPAARETRRLEPEHSLQGIKRAATSDWVHGALVGWAEGPFGPYAMAKFAALYYGDKFFRLGDPLAARFELPPIAVQFALGMVLLIAFTGSLVCCAVGIGIRERRLAAEAEKAAALAEEMAAHEN
jgi:thiol-disulfide isomerase/thioredoxin